MAAFIAKQMVGDQLKSVKGESGVEVLTLLPPIGCWCHY